MQKFCIWETGYKIPKIDCIKLRCKNSASGNWIQNTFNRLHQAKMQKFYIWETGYKIPKIDCIKLRCKNSASGKLNMLCLCQYRPTLLRFWFQTDLRRKNSASFFKIQAGKTFSYHGHVLVTLHVQFLCSDWLKFDGWVHA